MRILAIRGRNLASLGGTFEVDFRAEPLASAGLYAITGPTGAGKSTLLDALCLALYGDTPRLLRAQAKGSNLPDVGAETLGAQDVRSLLRRGSAEGYAEVEFMGSDGVAYRARWSVRRARTRAEGKLQAAETSLVRLDDGQPVAGHLKSEVQAAIQARIGLTFEQFTRAVLLAQNEFSAFLKTGDDERADLLEQLTGTDRYSDLSRRAFARAKAERDQVGRTRAELASQQPMDAPGRAALLVELQQVQRQQEAAEGRYRLMHDAVRWHEEQEHLARSLAEACAVAQATRASLQQAAPRRTLLQRTAAAQPARPLVEALDRQAHAMQRAATEAAAAAERLQRAERARAHAHDNAMQARATLDGARLAQQQAASVLARASALDVTIALVEPAWAQAAQAHRRAVEAAQARAQAHAALVSRQRDARAVLQQDQAWLEDHAGLRTLALGWVGWQRQLVGAGKALAAANRARDDLARAAAARSGAEGALRASQAAADEAARALAATRGVLDGAAAACATVDLRASAARKAAAGRLRASLAVADGVVRARAARARQVEALGAQLAGAVAAVAQHEAALSVVRSARAQAQRVLEQAERSARQGEVAAGADVARLRTTLESGVPCPVCGAMDHPYAMHDPRLDAVLESLRREVDRCRADERRLEAEERWHGGELEGARARRGAARMQLDGLAADAASGPAWPDDLPAVPEVEQDTWIATAMAAADADVARIAAEEAAMLATLDARDQAQAAADVAASGNAAATAALVAARQQHDRLAQQIEFAQGEAARCEAMLAASLSELDGAWETDVWRARFLSDPGAFQRDTQLEVEAWLARAASLDAQRRIVERLQGEIGGAADAAAAAAAEAARAQDSLARSEAELAQHRAHRLALFGGRAVTEVAADLAAAVGLGTRAVDDAGLGLERANAEHARAAEAHAQALAQRDAAHRAQRDATSALETWLATFDGAPGTAHGVPLLDQIRELLGQPTTWIDATRGELERLERAAATAATLVGEREAGLARHGTQRPLPELCDLSQAQAACAAAGADVAQLRPRLAALEGRRQDDERRIRVAGELAVRVERQEAAAQVWERLNDLIGSADGRKFRNHAQQFTLDVLLEHANHHLQALARRYRLRRIPDSLGLLVVDRDMADELRSVHSLSGGESFLVSLALALGLASLSSHRVQVESLFIDEGFGSLDPDALAIAMAALDGLQSQGRKVGVISHVQDMTERIGTRIEVYKLPAGQSRLRVVSD